MRFLNNTKFDFLGWRRAGFAGSAILIGIGVVSLILNGGPRLGIDFAGGSQVVVRFADRPDLNQLRQSLTQAGLTSATLQEFEAASNEILIRTPGTTDGSEIDAEVTKVRAALDAMYAAETAGGLDINASGRDELRALLLAANTGGYDLAVATDSAEAAYGAEVQKILDLRANVGVVTSWEQVESTGIDPAALGVLRAGCRIGGYAIVNSESVGPQVGQDLRRQATQAIVWALLGMLAYISYRFEFKFGVAAVVALAHDVMVTMGAFSLTGREFNLPVVAAFLTIVGYSLNDTVVIFDRVRENSTAMRRMPLYDRINASLNQTLSRTVLTSGTTLFVVVSLYLFGGPVINDFAFALLVGIIAGTYSTLFVATPIVYMWQERDAARRR